MTNHLDQIRRQAAEAKKSARIELVLETTDKENKVSHEPSGIHAEASLEGAASLVLTDQNHGRFTIHADALKSLHTFIGTLIEEV